MAKFYAVQCGRRPGVYFKWSDCQKQIAGYKGSFYKVFPTYRAAQAFLDGEERPRPKHKIYKSVMAKPQDGVALSQRNYTKEAPSVIYCFGGQSIQIGAVVYAAVVNEKSEDLNRIAIKELADFERDLITLPGLERYIVISDFFDVAIQQNSGAELIAMYIALKTAQLNPTYKTIRSDSWRMVDHWSVRFDASKTPRMDKRKVGLIQEVISLRKDFESSGGVIQKITRSDNLACLG